MKKVKKGWRIMRPLLLIGIGLIVGALIVEANSSTVVYHHEYDHSEFMMEHQVEIEREMAQLEIELDQMMSDIEADIEISIPEIPAIPAIPEIPEIHTDHVQKIVIEQPQQSYNHHHGVHMSEMLGITGGIGIAMLFLMSVVLVFDEIRARRRS